MVELYDATDPVLQEKLATCAKKKRAFDDLPATSTIERQNALEDMLGSTNGPFILLAPFTIEFGTNLHIGERAFINSGCTFLDSAPIHIGSHAAIGPNVQFITTSHPKRPEDRKIPEPGKVPPFKVMTSAKSIHVEDHVWIGAGATILPGVRIGTGACVGAASVVTKDIPERAVAVGNPAKIVGTVDD